jgi:mono/diheme cytochrome c family protein
MQSGISSRGRRAKQLLIAAVAAAALAALTGCDLQENADTDRGQQLFTQKCGTCHTLAAAGTNANIGPNLDLAFQAARDAGMDQDTIEGVVTAQIENPRPASPNDVKVYMPPNLVEGDEANDVASYVASVAGTGAKPPKFVAQQFFTTNCGGCHTLSAAGTTGAVGPNLDQALPGQTAAEISQSITDPGAKPTPGFPTGVMPTGYGETLTPPQLQQLVTFLMQSVNGGGK